MKKLFYAVLLIALASCSYNQKDTDADDALADSLNNANAIDSLKIKYNSADLKMMELHGKVKSSTVTCFPCDKDGNVDIDIAWDNKKFYFDENGMMQKGFVFDLESSSQPKITRNGKGQIVNVEWYVEDYEATTGCTYTYYDNGMLKTCVEDGIESEAEIEYHYDKDGNLKKSNSHSVGEGSIYRTFGTYTVLDVDSCGNWTRRMFTNKIEEGPDDGSGNYTSSMLDYSMEIREIKYY